MNERRPSRPNRHEDRRVRRHGELEARNCRPSTRPSPSHDQTTPGLIHAIIRRVIFVDDDCWWRWWRVWLNDNADAGADVRLGGEFPAQPAAEHPGQHQHRQPDEREKQIHSPFCDDPIKKMEHGVEHYGRIQVHVISSGYALAITGSRVLDISANLLRIRSNSLNGGSSTCARRAYARWMALLLCPNASCANRAG